MGYESDFDVIAYPRTKENNNAVATAINEKERYDILSLKDDRSTARDTSWYEHREDILRVSRELPYLVIVLERSGEESVDLEQLAFKNGEVLYEWTCRKFPDIPSEILDKARDRPKTTLEEIMENLSLMTDEGQKEMLDNLMRTEKPIRNPNR